MTRFLRILVALVAAALLAACANPKDLKYLDARLDDHQQRLDALSGQVDESGTTVRTRQADLWAETESMRTKLAEISGELELLRRQVKGNGIASEEASAKLDGLSEDVADIRTAWGMLASEMALDITLGGVRSERMAMAAQAAAAPQAGNATAPDAALTAGVNATATDASVNGSAPDAAPDAASSEQPPADPAEAAPAADAAGVNPAKALYDRARTMFEQRKYREGQLLWAEFTDTYTDHALVPNALFWQGECYFQMEDYARAVLMYQEVLDNHPKAVKYPTALYKQGIAFMRLGRIQAGRLLLQDVVDKFPQSWEAKRAAKILKQ